MSNHAYMLHVVMPCDLPHSWQFCRLAHISEKDGRSDEHFQTRPNIQLNSFTIEEAPDILSDLAKVAIHTIYTSGSISEEYVDAHPIEYLLQYAQKESLPSSLAINSYH